MPEIYTTVRNLFDFPNVLNAKIIASANGSAPFTEKFLYTFYNDGRMEIDATFYIEPGQTIADEEEILTLSNTSLFPSFIACNTGFMIVGADPNSFFTAAAYNPSATNVIYKGNAIVPTLVEAVQYYMRGTIVPHNVKELGVNFFGG